MVKPSFIILSSFNEFLNRQQLNFKMWLYYIVGDTWTFCVTLNMDCTILQPWCKMGGRGGGGSLFHSNFISVALPANLIEEI